MVAFLSSTLVLSGLLPGGRALTSPGRSPDPTSREGKDRVPSGPRLRSAAVPERLRVTRTCQIPLDELEWRFSGSGGPGGQHANTANTRAEVRFDVAASPSLGPRQRARLLEQLGPVVRLVASDERSQARNRQLALERLAARLADGLRIDPVRVPTRPRKSASTNRVADKRRRSETKRLRARPSED